MTWVVRTLEEDMAIGRKPSFAFRCLVRSRWLLKAKPQEEVEDSGFPAEQIVLGPRAGWNQPKIWDGGGARQWEAQVVSPLTPLLSPGITLLWPPLSSLLVIPSDTLHSGP